MCLYKMFRRKQFRKQRLQIMNSLFYEIKEFGSVEADYFLENCFNSFFLSLEELKK